ncbi:NAD-dependent epimerase/dehydratase family protein [bacterium]|nr:NAD-dependent epimerase/dehydratase family protein [bacterium]
MASIAVVGAQGYVGRALVMALKSSAYEVTPVTRDTYTDSMHGSYDVLINAAMPSARFKAKEDPEWDFRETVAKTADLLYRWKFGKFVQISTISARSQLDTMYGRHKAAAESLCSAKDNLIVRLGAMYSEDLQKGVLVDMVSGRPVFVDGESRYCFASRDFVASWIVSNLDRTGIVEVGGREAVALKDIAAHLGTNILFQGVVDHQEISEPHDDFPYAREVFTFLDNWKPKL